MGSIISKAYVLKSGTEILIRDAVIDEAEKINELIDEIQKEEIYMMREPDEKNFTTDSMKEFIKSNLENPGSLFIVAEAGGKIAGYLEFRNGSLRRTLHAGAFSIYILKDFRNLTIGNLLMQTLLDWAQASPVIEKITLAVFSTNKRAINFYRKFGFIEEGRCPKDMKITDGTYIDSVLMYKFVK